MPPARPFPLLAVLAALALGLAASKPDPDAPVDPEVGQAAPEIPLNYAASMSVERELPIRFGYWLPSLAGVCCVGVRDRQLFLARSEHGHLSAPIVKVSRFDDDVALIVLTIDAIYLVSADIPVRKLADGDRCGA